MSSPERCPTCGAAIPEDAQLAAIAVQADVALRGMKLAVPDVARRGLHAVAMALRCRAGLCVGSETP
jgi:hypothetical protein